MLSRAQLPGIVRFLYAHNPFYVTSAACIIYTLKLAFRPGEVAYIDPWALMAAMGGYTLLMAVTGYLVVKWGRVWEDARTIFLVLLLLFLATSVTFDELLNLDPADGKLLITTGFALAVLVSEGVFHGLGIRLPLLFRIPYHLWLVLLYFFPIQVSPELTGLNVIDTSWRLLAFPVIAGALTLALIPGVRRGAEYCNHNGTPWSWPWVPWPLFIFIGLATLFRTYALTISFLPSEAMETAFQPYFFVPFLFAVLILMLEIGRVERYQPLISLTLNLSPLLLVLAESRARGGGPSVQFLDEVTGRCGSPLWLTVCGLALFYGVSWLRGVSGTPWRMWLAVIMLVRVGPQTVDLTTMTVPQPWPLLLIGGCELLRSVIRRQSLPTLLSSICLAWALNVWLGESSWFLYRRIIPYHVVLLFILVLGGLKWDGAAPFLRAVGAFLLPVMTGISLMVADHLVWTHYGWSVYVVGMVSTTVLCWLWTADRAFLYSLLCMVIAASCQSIYMTLGWLTRRVGARVLIPLALGVGSFVVAIGITAIKAGAGRSWFQRLGLIKEDG